MQSIKESLLDHVWVVGRVEFGVLGENTLVSVHVLLSLEKGIVRAVELVICWGRS